MLLELLKTIWRITAVKLFLLIVLLLLVVWGVFYIATHGRVVIEGKLDETVVLLKKEATPKDQIEFKGTSKIVVSGTYLVRNDQDGRLRVAKVEVKGWFQESKVTFEDTASKPVTKVASLTSGKVFGSPGNYKSIDTTQDPVIGYTKHSPDDAFGLKNQEVLLTKEQQMGNLVVVGPDTLAGLVGDERSSKVEVGLLNTTTGKRMILPHQIDFEEETRTAVWPANSESASDFFLYQGDKQNIYYFYGTNKLDIPVNGIAKFDKRPLVDANERFVAAIIGNDYEAVQVDAEEVEEPKDTYIRVTDTKTGQEVSKFQIPASRQITDVAVSNEGNVAVIDNNQLWVYGSDGTYVLSDPYSTTNHIGWKSANELISASVESGVHLIDVPSGKLSTLFNTKNLAISDIFITSMGIYFTAFSENDEGSNLPDGFFVDFASNSAIASDTYMNTVAALPIFRDEYKIGIIGNQIVVDVFTLASDNPTSPAFKQYAERVKEGARSILVGKLGEETVNQFTLTTQAKGVRLF